MSLRPAVFLDRDGVLNALVDRGPDFRIGKEAIRWTAPFCREEIVLLPRIREALEAIGAKGFLCIVTTNQPDVAGGRISHEEFRAMMAVFRALPLDGIFACPHRPRAGCACRKPKPGLLLAAQGKYGINLATSYMVGDMETDVEAGIAAGVRTIRIADTPDPESKAHHYATSLWDAVALIK